MPKDTQVQVLGGSDKALTDFCSINDRVTFKFDASY
jgi:hypothetical protein